MSKLGKFPSHHCGEGFTKNCLLDESKPSGQGWETFKDVDHFGLLDWYTCKVWSSDPHGLRMKMNVNKKFYISSESRIIKNHLFRASSQITVLYSNGEQQPNPAARKKKGKAHFTSAFIL